MNAPRTKPARLSLRSTVSVAVALLSLFLMAATVVGANVNASSSAEYEEEVDIAISPANPLVMMGGSNSQGNGVYASVFESSNGGATWSSQFLVPPAGSPSYPSSCDPATAFDRNGNKYFAGIGVNYSSGITSLFVWRKPVGSSSWTGVKVPNTNADKEFIVTDNTPTSPCVDSVYVAWDDNTNSGQKLQISRSTNGAQSFPSPVQVNDITAVAIGAYPAVHPDGTVFVAWSDYQYNRLLFDRSSNCGASFGTDKIVHTWSLPSDCTDGMGTCPTAAPNRGIPVMPYLAVDLSNGPHRGRVFIVYNDYDSTHQDIDIYLRYSDDKGSTWTSPLRVNDDTGRNDQFEPRVAVDPADGSVHVAFYDTRDDTTRRKVHVYYALSANGGQSFQPNVRVSTAQTDHSAPAQSMDFGEYMGLAAIGGRVQVFWTDNRNGNEEVFTAPITNGLTIGNTTLPDGLVGKAYNTSLVAIAGTPPYTWTVTGLPSTLTASTSTGAITGTPVAGNVGAYTVSVSVKDAANVTAARSFPLTVRFDPVVISTTALPSALVNTPYSTTIQAAGGVTPYAWSLTGLPSTLSFNATTGAISGTPGVADIKSYSLTVQVTDAVGTTATKSLTLAVTTPPLVITNASLPNGGINQAYSATLQGTGGMPPYTWSAVGLPTSLTLNGGSGAISGTPTAADSGGHTVNVTLSDSVGGTTTKPLQLVVSSNPLSITTSSLPEGQESTPYGPVTLQRTGGAAPFTWSFGGGVSLPQGLTLSSSGVLSGTLGAGTGGTYNLPIVLVDSSVPVQTATAWVPLVVLGGPVANAGDNRTVDPGTVTLDGSKSFDPAGGTLTYKWTPPQGIVMSNDTAVSPTFFATRSRDYVFSLVVTSSTGRASAPAQVTITVRNIAPTVSISAPTEMQVGQPSVLDGSASTDPNMDPLIFTWSQVSGPSSVALSSMATAQTGFTPPTEGTYSFMLTVSDGASYSSASVSISVVKAGCGCGAGGGEAALGGVLLLVGRSFWRRRARR